MRAMVPPGMSISDVVQTRPAGWQGIERVETRGLLGMKFGRAITKIVLNYLAHEYGAATALMVQFSEARRFARHGARLDERRLWTMMETSGGDTGPVGHRISIEWDRRGGSVAAEITFHQWARYRVALGSGFIVLPQQDRCHFFDLSTMTVRRIK